MEQLNNQQIVLLVLLVSFVTSIATGIVTVTLMQQAPAGITQTINKVVERTVENVVPAETKIVVGDSLGGSEGIVKIIKSYSPSIVTISNEEGVDTTGFVSSGEGHIITRSGNLAEGSEVTVKYQNKKHPAMVIGVNEEYEVALLKFKDPGAPKISYIPLQKISPKIGQEILILGKTAAEGMTAQEGLIVGAGGFLDPLFTARAYISKANSGGPVITKEGILLGISYYSDEKTGAKVIPMSEIQEMLELHDLALIEADTQTASVLRSIDETE